MKTIKMEFEGREVIGVVLKTTTHLWVHVAGRAHCIELQKQRSHKKQDQLKDPTKIFAPMPGKIIKVNVSAGMKIEEGETLVVMEAMKMEYAMKAATSGVAETVTCKQGGQVALGDLLVEIKTLS